MKLRRLLRHLLLPDWWARRHFPAALLKRIELAVAESERGHCGELRFAVEASLHPMQLLAGVTARERALELFSRLGVWDTAGNSGVLIYLLLADRDVEIVADRGIAARVHSEEWEAICREMEACFAAGDHATGALQGIARIDALLRRHYPANADNPNELPDAASML